MPVGRTLRIAKLTLERVVRPGHGDDDGRTELVVTRLHTAALAAGWLLASGVLLVVGFVILVLALGAVALALRGEFALTQVQALFLRFVVRHVVMDGLLPCCWRPRRPGWHWSVSRRPWSAGGCAGPSASLPSPPCGFR